MVVVIVSQHWESHGHRINIKGVFPCIEIPMLTIRQLRGRLILNMVIPTLTRIHLNIGTAPGCWQSFQMKTKLSVWHKININLLMAWWRKWGRTPEASLLTEFAWKYQEVYYNNCFNSEGKLTLLIIIACLQNQWTLEIRQFGGG